MTYLTDASQPCRRSPKRRTSLLDYMALYRQRRALAELDGDRLEDLGLTRQQADAESRRFFWEGPDRKH